METTIQKELEKIKSIQPDIQDYSHIELTDQEVISAILEAKIRKEREMEKQNELQENQRRIADLLKPKDYGELKQFVLDKAKTFPFHFDIDDDNKTVFRLLCLYFSNDPQFEKEGFYSGDQLVQQYSLNKGICLYSKERGTGKTVMMNLFTLNSKNCFVVIPTKKIAAFYQASGNGVIDNYSRPWMCMKEPKYLFQSPIGICYDDLGDEEIKNNFGNKENVMQRVLQQVYDSDPQHEWFKYFHCTTNLSGDEIEAMYDKRVRSRMREMFNWIELGGTDRR